MKIRVNPDTVDPHTEDDSLVWVLATDIDADASIVDVDASSAQLDVEELREIAHRELEIARLMGPSDEYEQAWLTYLERLLGLTDEYLKRVRHTTG